MCGCIAQVGFGEGEVVLGGGEAGGHFGQGVAEGGGLGEGGAEGGFEGWEGGGALAWGFVGRRWRWRWRREAGGGEAFSAGASAAL